MSVEASLGEEARRELASLEQGLADADPPIAAALHFRSAQLWLGVGAPGLDPAAAHLRSALDLDPTDEDAFDLLASALRRAGKRAELARACEEACREAPAQKRAQRLTLAAALYDELGRVDEAAMCRSRVLAIPGDAHRAARLGAGQALAQTHRKKGAWRELAAVLDKLAADLDGDARMAALADQAEVLGDRVGAHGEAWEAWLKVLARCADDDRALAFARRHLDETHQPVELAKVLAAAAAAARHHDRATQLWREAAQVAEERARDLELARRAWRRAWQLSPLDAEARAALKRLLALAGDWRGYRDLLEREARQVASVEEKIEVYRELAAFQRQVLRDDRSAAEVYGLVLQLSPREGEALSARVEIFEAASDEVQLIEALRRQLRQAKPETRSALRARLAEALRRQGQVAAAALVIEPALRETPSAEVSKTVERVREAAERAGELRAVARLRLATGDKKGAAEALERAGERESARRLWRELGDKDAVARLDARPDPTEQDIAALLDEAQAAGARVAAGLHYRVAQIYAHREPPERDKARAQLELALEHWPGDDQSFALLERLLEADAQWDRLVELYRGAVAEAREEVRRVDLLGRLARVLRDRRGDAEGATAAYEQLLAIDPANADTQAALEQLYRQTGKLAGVVRLYENELTRTAGDGRVGVLARLARLLAGEMKDEPAATARWKEVLQIDPGHAEALAFCRARAEHAEKWRDVVLLLARAADAAKMPVVRAACWREMASLSEQKLDDREGAATAWRRVCEILPDDADARASLRRLLAELGRFADLAATLRADVARALSPETKLPLLEALATVERERLEDVAAAAGTLWAIVQIVPDHKAAHDELALLLDKLGHHRERAALLRRRLTLAEGPAERVEVLRKLALLLRGPLGAVPEAITTYREILGIAPGDDGALASLREIHGSRNEWKELAAVLQSALGAKNDTAREAALRLELGRLLDEKLGQREEAAKELERGLAVDRANPEILGALARLYEAMSSWEKLVETLKRRAGGEPGGLSQALCDIGRIYDDKMGDLGRAREAFEQAVHLDPTRRGALSALRSIAERRADWREAVALARREEKLITDPRERAALLFSVGNLLVDKLDRPARAAETFEEALRADAGHLGAAERLADLYFAQNDYVRAAPLLEKLVERGAARDRAHDLYYRLGMAAEKGGEADKAFAHYIQSFNHDSMYEPTLTRLAELCFERGQWENTVRVCEAIAQLAADRVVTEEEKKSKTQKAQPGVIHTTEELAELYHRHAMAELHLGQRNAALRLLPELALGGGQRSVLPEIAWRDVADSWASLRLEPRLLAQIDPPARRRAEGAIGRCLALKPKHVGALQALAALAVARQKWDDALLQLDRCVDVHELEKLRRCDLLLLAGDICAKKTLDRPRAERYYRRALQLFPQDGAIRKRLEAVKQPR